MTKIRNKTNFYLLKNVKSSTLVKDAATNAPVSKKIQSHVLKQMEHASASLAGQVQIVLWMWMNVVVVLCVMSANRRDV